MVLFVKGKIYPKSTACFFNILEKKMSDGETASFAPTLTNSSLLSK